MYKITDISDYQPKFIKSVREFEHISETENIQFLFLWDEAEKAFLNQFIDTMTEIGVARWEGILNIVPKVKDELIERKARILLRLNNSTPYTYRTLKNMLDMICGEDGHNFSIVYNEYKLIVRVMLDRRKCLKEVDEMLKRIVPANISIDLDLFFNRHFEAARYMHYELNGYTHEEIRERALPLYTEHNDIVKYKLLRHMGYTYSDLGIYNHEEIRNAYFDRYTPHKNLEQQNYFTLARYTHDEIRLKQMKNHKMYRDIVNKNCLNLSKYTHEEIRNNELNIYTQQNYVKNYTNNMLSKYKYNHIMNMERSVWN